MAAQDLDFKANSYIVARWRGPMFCVIGMPGTAYDYYGVDDEFTTARIICIHGIDKQVCGTTTIVKDAIQELRRVIDDAVRACIEGRLDENQVYERIADITKRVAAQAKLDGEKQHRVDTTVELELTCGGELQELRFIGAYINVYGGRFGNLWRRLEPRTIEEVCKHWLSEECRRPRRLKVHYWIAVRHAFDKQRVFGRTDDEHFRYAVLGIDGVAEDEYVLTNRLVLRRTDSTVYVSLEMSHDKDYLSTLAWSDAPKKPRTVMVSAECRDGILRMYVYNEEDEGEYPVICRAFI